jgi:hypothetical protein
MDISIAGLRLPDLIKGFWVREQAKRERVHNYTHQTQGFNYFLSPAEESSQVYMTADGSGIQRHDYVLLKGETGSTQYQVQGIEYYSDSPTLWTALLVKC